MQTERGDQRGPSAPRRAWLIAAVGVLALAALGSPAAAQDPVDEDPPKTEEEQAAAAAALLQTLVLAPEAPPAADDPFAAIVETVQTADRLAMARLEATRLADEANLAAFLGATALAEAVQAQDAAIALKDAAASELDIERERLSDLTVQAYVTRGEVDIDQYQAYLEGDTTDPAAGRTLMFSQVLEIQEQATADASTLLRKAREGVAAADAVVEEAEAELRRLQAISTRRAQARQSADRAHIEAVAAAEEAEVRLRTASAEPTEMVPQEVPIIGLPRLTGADLASWFASSSYRPRVATPIEDYAEWFIAEGMVEGIRGDIAFAQAVLETGGFTNTDSVEGHNFSGIGHYDNLARGWTFPSPRLGVRAQMQLLKSYAVEEPDYANELVDRRLRGPAGCCETWGDLTTVWATDPTYGPKVMLIYTAIVDHALERRARGEGFDDPVA